MSLKDRTDKYCPACEKTKLIGDFYSSKNRRDGRSVYCKVCHNIRGSEYSKKNRDKRNLTCSKWLEGNKEKPREYAANYRKLYPDRVKATAKIQNAKSKTKKAQLEYCNKRRHSDSLYRLTVSIRNSIGQKLREGGFRKKDRTLNILGCNFETLKYHLESKFESWMNWNNYGNKNGIAREKNFSWDIDHIIPICSAKTEEEVLKLNHYTNLQPLCSFTNRNIKRGIFKI